MGTVKTIGNFFPSNPMDHDVQNDVYYELEYEDHPYYPAVLWGDNAHPEEGGPEPIKLTRSGKEVNLDENQDIVDALIERIFEGKY